MSLSNRVATAVSGDFQHEAFLYRGLGEFLDSCASFIVDGRLRREPVLVAVDSDKIAGLTSRLGTVADEVAFVVMEKEGRNPGRIISLWHEFVDRNAGRPIRGIGEPIWAGRDAHELPECQQHEHLLNHAFDGGGRFKLRCPYDIGALDASVIEEAMRSHPVIHSARGTEVSATYERPAGHALLGAPLGAPPATAVPLAVRRSSLHDTRLALTTAAEEAGLDRDRAGDVVLVVSELLANSLQHAVDLPELRLWVTDRRLVCDVRDDGRLADPLAGRQRPSSTQARGRGLWITHELADLVQIRSDSSGTTVRVSFELPA